jgi:hypothetical protein
MKVVAEDMGQDALEMMLRKATSDAVRRITSKRFKDLTDRSLTTFARLFEKPSRTLENAASYEIVENNGEVLELKVSECLWAKVFRDADAAGLGYAYICFPDYTMAQAFNPKIVMKRSKTLMQGDGFCNHRYEMEG